MISCRLFAKKSTRFCLKEEEASKFNVDIAISYPLHLEYDPEKRDIIKSNNIAVDTPLKFIELPIIRVINLGN